MSKQILEKNYGLSQEQLNKFESFCDFLLENNKRFNLTAIREKNAVYVKHFLDSLKGLEFFSDNCKILEIGSGGGFPSVPLKIANEKLNLTLVEATGKKCVYLNQVKELFGFENFEVINSRCEELVSKGFREKFDIVTARAVASLNVLLELCGPFLKVGAKCVFYKNYSLSEIQEAQNALTKLNCKILSVKEYTLDNESEKRCILIIQKNGKTPEIYPREYKKILKNPL